jgi:hypothetical protein
VEGVRIQRKLHTAASSCLRLSCFQQPAADAPPAHVLAHPERINPARPAPAPAVHAGHQLAVAIGLDGQQLAEISDAVASTLNSLISSIKRRAVARSASLTTSLLRSSVISVALSLPVRRHGRLALATDDQPAVRRAAAQYVAALLR